MYTVSEQNLQFITRSCQHFGILININPLDYLTKGFEFNFLIESGVEMLC